LAIEPITPISVQWLKPRPSTSRIPRPGTGVTPVPLTKPLSLDGWLSLSPVPRSSSTPCAHAAHNANARLQCCNGASERRDVVLRRNKRSLRCCMRNGRSWRPRPRRSLATASTCQNRQADHGRAAAIVEPGPSHHLGPCAASVLQCTTCVRACILLPASRHRPRHGRAQPLPMKRTCRASNTRLILLEPRLWTALLQTQPSRLPQLHWTQARLGGNPFPTSK